MPDYNFKTSRIFIENDLSLDASIELSIAQSHYLSNVMRLKAKDELLVFNGTQGEWLAQIELQNKKNVTLKLVQQTRPQTQAGNVRLLFAPIKQARMEFIIEKAVELGACSIEPVLTQHTQIKNLNLERFNRIVLEAAEQCGILSIPKVCPAQKLDEKLSHLDANEKVIFCDERAHDESAIEKIQAIQNCKIAILIGPEGGFSQKERETLWKMEHIVPISLGPRILRAETAAISALSLVQNIIES